MPVNLKAKKSPDPLHRVDQSSRMLIRYRNGHMGDTLVSLINLVQWVRTFFGLQIDGHGQRNPMVPLVLL